jgi:hypothetical protein
MVAFSPKRRVVVAGNPIGLPIKFNVHHLIQKVYKNKNSIIIGLLSDLLRSTTSLFIWL